MSLSILGQKISVSDDDSSTFGCGSEFLMHNRRFLLILRPFVLTCFWMSLLDTALTSSTG